MIFNTFFQMTLQAAFADESPIRIASKDLLSTSLIRQRKRAFEPDTPIAHADHDVQPAAKRPKHVLVNTASAPRIDTNMELIVNPLPKSALVSRPPTAATFLDLPSELFALIMTYLPTTDLLHLAQQFNDRLKAESTRAYLIRINILHNHDVVYLTRDVPAIAVHLLSAVQLFDEVSLVCDLFYFVEYGKELCNFAMTKARVRSLCINFHPKEKSLLGDRRTSSSLVAFLTIVNECCRTLTFQRQLRDPSYRKLTIARPTRRLRPLPAYVTLPRLSTLTISALILGVPSLATTCRRLLQSPQVKTFQLDDCKTQQECNGVLAMSTFPVLGSIIIRTVDNTVLSIEPAFFHRHATINTLTLNAYAIYSSATLPAVPRSQIPLPGLTHLNLTTNHDLRMLEGPDQLRRCYLQTPNSFVQPQSVEFCSNLSSLCTFASNLAQYHFKGLELSIQLPNSILYHVAHFQHSGDVCSCITFPSRRLLGVETLEVDVDSFNTVVADHIYNWAKVCPDIVKLNIVHGSTVDDMDLIHIDDFVTHCGTALSKLTEVKCFAGKWMRQPSGYWLRN